MSARQSYLRVCSLSSHPERSRLGQGLHEHLVPMPQHRKRPASHRQGLLLRLGYVGQQLTLDLQVYNRVRSIVLKADSTVGLQQSKRYDLT